MWPRIRTLARPCKGRASRNETFQVKAERNAVGGVGIRARGRNFLDSIANSYFDGLVAPPGMRCSPRVSTTTAPLSRITAFSARSADGTSIVAQKSGEGPPLVVVHGIAGDATRWTTVRARLSAKFTLFAVDRRGRGASGDSPSYSIVREAEDVVALVDAIGEDVFLLGHSFGGVVALEASSMLVERTKAPRVTKLMVYEPFVPALPAPEATPLMREYLALSEAGDREALVLRFLREIVQMSDAEIGRLRSHSSWPARVAAAPTIAREMAAIERHRFDPAPLVSDGLAIRMLLGEQSPAFLREATSRLASMLPGTRIVELPQQKHIAMDTAPDLFVREVSSFFEPVSR